ncbi:MAG: type II toxin-antitoxin system Phd/YefM family antitoxin [Ramlibacter sp.]
MQAVTYTHARNHLTATMDKTIQDHEPVIITRQNGGAVVMMSLEDFQAWEETAYLLNSPANARKLMKSLDEASRGKTQSKTLPQLRKLAAG